MKRLEDYTNKELSKLTSKEVDDLIDIECMAAGVPLSIMPQPILKEVPEIPEPTKEVFSVDDYYFTDKEEADKLANLLTFIESRVRLDYNYNVGNSNYKYYKKGEIPTSVKKSYCYSDEEYKELFNIIKAKTEIEKLNKVSIDNYNEIMSERNNIINNVYRAIDNAVDEMNEINNALNIYKRYIELSDGNEEIAQKFFKQNNNISKYFDVVIEEYKPEIK